MGIKEMYNKVASLEVIFLIGWIIAAVYSLNFFDLKLINLVYFISSLLLSAHIIYGGYTIFRYLDNSVPLSRIFGFILWMLVIFLLPLGIDRPAVWFCGLGLIFIIALLFHAHTYRLTRKHYLKKFCKYKIQLEINSIAFCIIGIISNLIFSNNIYIGILSLIVIILINLKMFFIDKVYLKLALDARIK